MVTFLDFEKPIAELEAKIKELQAMPATQGISIAEDVARLEVKADLLLRQTYGKLSAWQKTQVARHQSRPRFNDYVRMLIEDFVPLAGDRAFGDDKAILGGMGRFRGRPVVVIGHEKGSDTEGRLRHNFGMAKPEGYRKAIRLMGLADRFGMAIITLIDTPGAFPGVEAEARGQSEAIARSTEQCLRVGVPNVAVIVGEGGSGGAVALATANRVLMLEHAVYSVISPEGCASILWRSAEKAQDAAAALKLTAQDLIRLGVIDAVVSEPLGGAQRDPKAAIATVGHAISTALDEFKGKDPATIRRERREKFLALGRTAIA